MSRHRARLFFAVLSLCLYVYACREGVYAFVRVMPGVHVGSVETCVSVYVHMRPVYVQVEEECGKREVASQTDILEFLSKVTMVGLLPVPHPIIIRNYQPNVYTALWYTSFLWGVLLSSSPAFKNVNWAKIRLLVMHS